MPTLKAKVGGVWVPVGGGSGGGAEEVYVGANDPGAGFDLWYDTDEVGLGVDTRLLPRGWVGQGIPSVDTTGIGATMTDITGMSVAFTADPTRRYKTSVLFVCYPSVGPASIVAQIANAAGTLMKRSFVTVPTANYYATVTVALVESGLSGAQTRKAMVSTSAGTLVTYAASTSALILVEDIGGV